jgi:SPOR domain
MSLLGSFSSAIFLGVAVRPAVPPVQPTIMIHWTEMIMRRFPQMDEDRYSCKVRPMTGTTQRSRLLRLAEVTARVIITTISCAGGGGLAFAISLLALTVLGTVGTFGYVFSALPPIVKDGTKLDSAVGNYSDASKSSVTSVGSNEKLASREQQPGITAPGRDPAPAASALDPDVPAPVSTPSSVQVLVPVLEPVSSEPKKIHAVMIGSDGRSATDTTWLPVYPPHSPRRAAARSSTAAPPPSGSHGVHRDTSPSTPSRFHVRAGRRTAREAYAAGSYAVQLASEHSAAAAHASFRALRATFPNQLGGCKPTVRRTDLGAKGIYYRAMVGPFASMEKAAGMCGRLKTAGCNCLVQRN